MLGIIDQRFELLAHLEESPSETVYYARDRVTGTPVLVRELAADFFGDPESFDLFLQEYDQISRLVYHAVLKPYSLRRAADGRVFIVSEYVTGVSLRVFLDLLASDEETCPLSPAAHIIGKVALVLQAAHELVDEKTGEPLHLLHLDVCPTSILLTSEGGVKLKGYDLVRLRHRNAISDRPGRLAYLPPERIGGGAYLDRRSDLFSLGICLYELLTGSVPFVGRSTARIRKRIIEGEGDFSPLDQADIPPELRVIVRRAMAREPDSRYPDCCAFLTDFKKVFSTPKPAAANQELARLLRRRVGPEWFQPPKEEFRRELLDLVTTPVRETHMQQGEITAPIKVIPEPPAPVPDALEPIAALVRKGSLAKEMPKTTGRRQRRFGPGLWASIAVVIVLALVLDVFLGLTPLGRSIDFSTDSRPQEPQIVSVPVGAAIYINDQYVGRTPRTVKRWPDGVTTVRLEYSGFAPAETILVLENQAPRDLPVFVLERTVSIRTRPPGADIYINGRSIPAVRAAGYTLRATDTISIEVRKAGFRAPSPFILSAEGPLGDFDRERWDFEELTGETQMNITAAFSRAITISSRPPGAEIYLDSDSVSVGVTAVALDLALGPHRITLRRPSFLDYTFEIDVTEDSPGRYTPMLGRFIRISAVSEDSRSEDIGAEIRWVRRGERLIKGPDDKLRTPYSLNLEAADHEIMLTRKGYRDTLVFLSSGVGALTVIMRPEGESSSSTGGETDRRPEPEVFKWVRFSVEASGEPVSGATVIGYETESGERYEFGTTGKEGRLLVKVPPGEFSFVALRDGNRSNTKDSRIKPGRKIKSITLKFRQN